MKVLLTGGCGYIGSHVAVVLMSAGHEVVIVDDLSNSHRDVIGRRLLGHDVGEAQPRRMAGGAAAGALGSLIEQQPRRIVVTNRTQAKAVALIAQHAAIAALHKVELVSLDRQALEADLTQCFDIVINATASSLAGADVPAPASVLHARTLAYDMMYGPAAQNFLDWASSHGALARDGLGMLVEQAAESFAMWRGVRPPSTQVLAELRELLQTEAAR